MKTDARLEYIDNNIKFWTDMCVKFPTNKEYKYHLAKFQQDRAEYANKIGRKLN